MAHKLPHHLVAIPDGNRRWAKKRGLVPWKGHEEGMKRFREIKEVVFRLGIPYFTFWAASYDNLTKRSRIEIRFLLSIFRRELQRELREKNFVKNQTRIRILGEWRDIIKNKGLQETAETLEEESHYFEKFNLTILLGYDGIHEMVEGIKKIKKSPKTKIDYESVKSVLWSSALPPIDFIIRTGAERDPHNSSGFMMWHTAWSQLYFTEKFWPDFDGKELKTALLEYAERERRFGT